MRQRLSVVTLGVRDKDRARRFYEALGWSAGPAPGEDPVFFQCGDMVVALWDRALLAVDSEVTDSGGWGGVTLALNVESPAEVDRVAAEVRATGDGRVAREPTPTFWGGYSTIVIDPDGHPWEIAHNPHWRLDDNGGVHLPS